MMEEINGVNAVFRKLNSCISLNYKGYAAATPKFRISNLKTLPPQIRFLATQEPAPLNPTPSGPPLKKRKEE
jgi:hypothetical protein